ncbi:hypothetical protein BK127_02680 [Paenibacillus sp. FSL H7-0331]|nr:hypothetical protein BK127_02680 [Paenibacillus sp. FSL H7-0331]
MLDGGIELTTKNQHYVARCILKNFSNNKLQIFEKLVESNKEPYLTKYTQAMTENYTYEHTNLETNELEDHFSIVYEDKFAPALVNLLQLLEEFDEGTGNILEVKKIIASHISTIIVFYYRSGALLHEFEYERNNKEDRIILLLENIMNSRYILELGKTIINKYQICIIKSDDCHFLLSDQYLSTAALGIKNNFFDMSNRHIGLKDVMILVPISSKYYIVFFDGKRPLYISPNKLISLKKEEVREINKVIINNSYVKCVAQYKEALLEASPQFEFKSPSATYAGFDSGSVMGSNRKKEIFFYENDERIWDFFGMHDLYKYSKSGANELCPCGSQMKFKRCHMDRYKGAKRMMDEIGQEQYERYLIDPNGMVERPIGAFYSNKKRPPLI